MYFNNTTKIYIVAFSKLFSDIHVKRYNNLGLEIKDIKVPLVYASKRKVSYMLQKNPNTTAASLVLPAIGFNIEGITFNSERKMNSLNEINVSDTHSVYEGMPYDFDFDLTIRSKYQEDYWQILEQILYLFKPELSLNVRELTGFPDFVRDVMVTLESISLEDEIEMSQDEDSSRDFRATLSLKLKGFVYPESTEDKLIEHVYINFINELNDEIINISSDWVDPDIITTITENY